MQRASQSSALCACRKYPGGCTTGQVKAVEATAHPWGLHPGPSTRVADVMPLHHIHLFILRIVLCARLERLQPLDTLGFEARAFRMRSGCDTTTPCALKWCANKCSCTHFGRRVVQRTTLGFEPSSSRMGRGCDATTPSGFGFRRPRRRSAVCFISSVCAESISIFSLV